VVIPVAMGLLDGNGQELETKLAGEAAAKSGTRVLLAGDTENHFHLRRCRQPAGPFAVPRLFRADQIIRHQSGTVAVPRRARHGSVRSLGVRAAIRDARAARPHPVWHATRPLTIDTGLIEAISETLAQDEKDPAFVAEAMYLPGEAFLADQMEIADVDAIHAVRDAARVAIGEALRDRLRATYDSYAETGPYSIDGAAIGRRSLRNACLTYLSAGGDPTLAKRQFDTAGNMTDSLVALAVLAGIECPERDAALAAFYAKWRDDPLVLDKWFSIQATSQLPDTVARVRALVRARGFRPPQSQPYSRSGRCLRRRQSGAVSRSEG
jgi:aminopeptidase N